MARALPTQSSTQSQPRRWAAGGAALVWIGALMAPRTTLPLPAQVAPEWIYHCRMAQTSVSLPPEHPGFVDPEYRRRRDEIARASASLTPGRGAEPPEVHYTPAEAALWREVSGALAERHHRYACAEYLRATRELDLPSDQVP